MSDPISDRAADLFVKQERLLALLRDVQRDGLLVMDPINFPWLSAGATAKGIPRLADWPVLYFQGPQRWLVCANTDSQRLFDEELDGLGFQLKEWPWHWGRAQLLADVCHGKKLACDVAFSDCLNVGDRLALARRTLSPWEQTRVRELGKVVAHALEATCRGIERGETEEEIAGQVTHRLTHRDVEPVMLFVAGDGRGNRYRRGGITRAKVERTCVLQTTARKWGLHVTASRTVHFGPPDDETRSEHELATRTTAVLITSSNAKTKVEDILAVGGRIMQMGGREHEWRNGPVGWLSGFVPVEWLFVPADTTNLEVGQMLVWQGNVGGAFNADTVLITESGPQIVTPPEGWPVKRIKIGGATVDRPDILVRKNPS
jgi:Xaa-Pro aminopeptidase